MMRVIEKTCSGCEMSSPNRMYKLIKHILAYIYIYDKRQYSNDRNNNKIKTIIKRLQKAAQSWEYLLDTIGGKLEISKCGIYIMKWTFHDDGRVIFVPMSSMNQHLLSNFYRMTTV